MGEPKVSYYFYFSYGKLSENQRNKSKIICNKKTPLGVDFIKVSCRQRRGWDSNPRCPCRHASFQDQSLKPLDHPSKGLFSFVELQNHNIRNQSQSINSKIKNLFQETCLREEFYLKILKWHKSGKIVSLKRLNPLI